MTDLVGIPVAGALFAKIIRACTVHDNTCPLECPEREVQDLGQIASFGEPVHEKGVPDDGEPGSVSR